MRNATYLDRTRTKEEIRLHVQKVHTNFPVIWSDYLPDDLVEKYKDCQQAFLEYYWRLSKEKEAKQKRLEEAKQK